MSQNITILLVDPENPDNIGAVARAMKNMGLRDLQLVRPQRLWKHKGLKLAVTAADVLKQARVFKTVEEAVADAHLVIGTTRRSGPRRGTFLDFREAMQKIQITRKQHQVCLMFGRESKGLDNASLKLCDWVTTIPVSPEQPSINLAQAVMIFAFSLFDLATTLPPPAPKRGHRKAFAEEVKPETDFLTNENVREVLDRLDEALDALGYGEQSDKKPRIRAVFHRLFKRTGLMESEAQMFRGLSRRIVDEMSKTKSEA